MTLIGSHARKVSPRWNIKVKAELTKIRQVLLVVNVL